MLFDNITHDCHFDLYSAANDPRPQMMMFIFCLCDVGYWIRVNTVKKVKRKNMLPKYFGSFTAEARTVYFFQVSSPFRGILRRNSEAITAHLIAFGGPIYTNILQN